MAGFCLECWNKINDANLSQKDVIISKDLHLCKECEQMKKIIVCYKKSRTTDILCNYQRH